jgi:endoglucanase
MRRQRPIAVRAGGDDRQYGRFDRWLLACARVRETMGLGSEPERRAFLDRLLETPSPSGFETRGQRVWLDYVSEFADDVWTDDYGNAVAVHEGGDTELALTGHADEVGFIVRRIDDDGYVRIGRIGGADRTVSKGQHVTIHADDPVSGVIGQTAIHLRETGEESYDDVSEQYVDVGAEDGDEAESLVSVGDPVTFSTTVEDLHGSRIAARGLDNRIGVWAAAEGLRRAVEADTDATVYAVSTIQEEVGLQGARMVGFDLAPDAVVAVDVTHATDSPGIPDKQRGPVELGEGPVLTRGSANHPVLVDLARDAADDADVGVQLQAAGSRTGTDADAFYTSAGGTPALTLGLPNRYMHTPVEVIDTTDLDDVATLLGAIAVRAADVDGFAVDV